MRPRGPQPVVLRLPVRRRTPLPKQTRSETQVTQSAQMEGLPRSTQGSHPVHWQRPPNVLRHRRHHSLERIL